MEKRTDECRQGIHPSFRPSAQPPATHDAASLTYTLLDTSKSRARPGLEGQQADGSLACREDPGRPFPSADSLIRGRWRAELGNY